VPTFARKFGAGFEIFEDDLKLIKPLYEAYPQNMEFKNGLANAYVNLGVFARDHQQDNASAKSYFKQTEILWIELVRDAPKYVAYQKSLSKVNKNLDALLWLNLCFQ